MYETLEQTMRPRRPKRSKSKFFIILAAALSVILALLTFLFSQSFQIETRKNSTRIEYSGGAILRIQLGAGEYASNFRDLESRLPELKDSGFSTLVLPVIQPSTEVTLADSLIRAPIDWNSIDEKYGTKAELIELIKSAHGNSQKVLLTLTTGWVSTLNSWYVQNPNWFYSASQLDRLAKSGKIKDAIPAGIAMPGGGQFRPMEYFSIVKSWKSDYEIDGVYAEMSFEGTNQLGGMALQEIKDKLGVRDSFLMFTNSSSSATRAGNLYSAVKSEILTSIIGSIKDNFNADQFASAMNSAFDESYGPKQIYSVSSESPNYLRNPSSTSSDLNFSTALAYALPGIPIIDSQELVDPKRFELLSKINLAFESIQSNDSNWSNNRAAFFVAGKDGTVAFGINRNGKKSVIVLNSTANSIENADFEVDPDFKGDFKDVSSGQTLTLNDVTKIQLQPLQVLLLTKN